VVGDECQVTIEELQELAKEWQAVLRLQDWDYDIRFARGFEIGDCFGDFNGNLDCRHAVIRVTDENDINDDNRRFYDQERTLVHELLHTYFQVFDTKDDSPERIAEEQAVDAISKAFVQMKRRLAGD
jgi:hypothetical protein